MINMLRGTDPSEQGNKKGRIHSTYRLNVFHHSQQASKISKMWMCNQAVEVSTAVDNYEFTQTLKDLSDIQFLLTLE